MIEFVTLLLGGLIVGLQPVEVIVDDSVEVVEIRLDGETVRRLESPPWSHEVDFGQVLAPRVLEAVALDREGREMDRASQWVNISPHSASTIVVIDRGRKGSGAVANVRWESLAFDSEPLEVEAFFDGREIEVEDPRTIPLPIHDPNQTHHFRVELEFSGSIRSMAEVTFGGVYGDRVSSELTALPIVLDKGVKLTSAADADGWFSVDDRRLGVHALETELAEIVVVCDSGVQRDLKRLASGMRQHRFSLRLREDHRVRLISPCSSQIVRQGYRHLIYPMSQQYSHEDAGLLWLLAWTRPVDCSPAVQKLADAVGVAGLVANQTSARRVVILVTGSAPQDASQLTPDQVKAYLRDLRVPFLVWNPVLGSDLEGEWGPAVNISNLTRISAAFSELKRMLARQRIVWLEGLHLPQRITLDPSVERVRLAGLP